MKPATPEQHTGSRSNTTHSITTHSSEQAEQLFKKARKNLLTINSWEALAGGLSAAFQLIDEAGNTARRTPQPGDFFKIDIPAPNNQSSTEYDWVQIEAVDDNQQNPKDAYTAIQVRPAAAPAGEKEACHHFFTREATSTFCVQRKGNTVTAGVYGRNEKPNIETKDLLSKMRNGIIGLLAVMGLNKPQWANLVKGILEKDADAITFQK